MVDSAISMSVINGSGSYTNGHYKYSTERKVLEIINGLTANFYLTEIKN